MEADPMNLATLIDELIQEQDDITAINETLVTCAEADLDLKYCQELVQRLLVFATKLEKTIKHADFGNTLEQTFTRIATKAPHKGVERLCKELKGILKELLQVHPIEDPNKTYRITSLSDTVIPSSKLIHLIAIVWGAQQRLLLIDPNYTRLAHPAVWSYTSAVLEAACHAKDRLAQTYILQTTSIYWQCFAKKLAAPGDPTSSQHICDLLEGVKQTLQLQSSFEEEMMDNFAKSIRSWLKMFTPSKLSCLYDIAELLEEICKYPSAQTLHSLIDIILLVSNLLFDNNVPLSCFQNYTSALGKARKLTPFHQAIVMKYDALFNKEEDQSLSTSLRKRIRLQSADDMDVCEGSQMQALQERIQKRHGGTVQKTWYLKTMLTLVTSAEQDETEASIMKTLDDIRYLGIRQSEGLFDESLTRIALSHVQQRSNDSSNTTGSVTQLSDKIAAMYDMLLPYYLRAYMCYALPYAVGASDETLLETLAQMVTSDTKSLCETGGHHLIISYFMSSDTAFTNQGFARLRSIFLDDEAPEKLLRSHQTKIVSSLAMRLADDDYDRAEVALNEVIEWLHITSATTLGEFLQSYYLAILSHVSKFITEIRERKPVLTHPNALAALDKILKLMGHGVQTHASQTMALFQTIGELPRMQHEVYNLWKRFAHALPFTVLSDCIGPIVRGVLSIFPRCSDEIKQDIGRFLEEILHACNLTMDRLLELPSIQPFEELDKVRELIDQKRDDLSIEQSIFAICKRARNDAASDILTLVEELLRILKKHGALHPVIVRQHSMLYTVLLYLSRKTGDIQNIRNLAAECLGLLGATDPSRLQVRVVQDDMIVLKNYTNPEENRDFVCHIIIKHLVPAFRKANNEETQQFVHESLAIQERWKKMPTNVQNMLYPLLASSFTGNMQIPMPHYPIYPSADSYETWIKRWYYLLTKSASDDSVRDLFAVFTSLVQREFFGLALDLIPRLVLHVALTGSKEKSADVIGEILCVLNGESHTPMHTEKMQRDALQVIVLTTEHCRKWIRDAQENHVNMDNGDITKVRNFLEQIPNDKMATASFRCKAYPQALMHLELYLKETMREHGGRFTSDVLDSMRQIYVHIDDPDGVVAVYSLFQRTLCMDEEIMLCEHMGDWNTASVMYRSVLDSPEQEATEDSRMLSGYFNCLRAGGNIEIMQSAATRLMRLYPQFLSRLNAYRAEASWKLEDWDTLDASLNQPIEQSFDGSLATAIAHFRQGNNLAGLVSIDKAQNYLMDHMLSASHDSYQQSYDHILGLQMIHELKQSRFIWEEATRSENCAPITELRSKWEQQFKFVAPSHCYQMKLLELRQAALFSMIPQGISLSAPIDDGSIWLTKAKVARKAGDMNTALYAILRAKKFGAPFVYLERAKWYWANEKKAEAIKYLQSQANPCAKAALLQAKYSEEFEKFDRTTMLSLYKRAQRLDQSWEKAMYYVGRYYDKNISDKDAKHVMQMSEKEMKIASCAVTSYIRALHLGSKYFYYTMPRFLTLWLEFGDVVESLNLITDTQTRTTAFEVFKSINTSIRNHLDGIHPRQFAMVLPRLVSRLSHPNEEVGNILMKIIGKVLAAYPRTTIWALLPPDESRNGKIRDRAQMICDKAENDPTNGRLLASIISQARKFTRVFKALAMEEPITEQTHYSTKTIPGLSEIANLELCIPSQKALLPELPEVSTVPYQGIETEDLPRIKGVSSSYEVMRSLMKPKKIALIGTDGNTYTFLVKKADDLRKDARMMEFNHMINTFLQKDANARERNLYIRTYGIIPLGEKWGLIEWINNLNPLKAIVAQEWALLGKDIRQIATHAGSLLVNAKTPEEKEKVFTNTILPRCPKVFHKWFLVHFPEPSEWFASRSRYIRTLAVMSIVGYILGLGDRHAENILFDQTNGDCVHVDVNMLFDKGANLTVPELVPFRLTQNLIDAMGILKVEGMFRKTCEVTLDVMRKNKTQLLSVFETLGHDPLADWQKKAPGRAKIHNGRTIESEVKRLIALASSNENLSQMFVGKV
ncbi:hypothetical protein BDB00DRAFT_943825 [Zychaea mexicana]|uniref:uncharacterized protein n=1 Tax=Zychaea mexicana TaxID=64656 RepID=UPI0022FF2E34|nr:uncharacterized protein BDB00DRAFT_943825 [Zychaea mexicana]KAI9468540.1 hypothetical protein BDB00DRAFT_943825 [Zychaea mexicana]